MTTRTLIHSFVEAAPHLAWSNRPDGSTEYVNAVFAKYVGVAAETVAAAGWISFVHPEDLVHVREERERGIKTEQPYHLEYRLRRADGVYRWHSAHVAPLRDIQHEIVGWYGSGLDIDEQRRSAEQVRESEARFRSLVEAISQVVWTVAPTGEAVDDLPSLRAFTGLSQEELTGWGWLRAMHPEDWERVRLEWEECVRDRRLFESEFRMRRHDGAWRWQHSRAVPILDASGAIREWIGANTDITERKQTETALRESEEQFQTLANSIPQLAWMGDASGDIFWYNQRWYDYTGTTLEEMKGWGWRKVHHPDLVEQVVAKVSRAFETGEPWEDIFPLRSRTGQWRWFLSRAIAIRDSQGRVVRWFGTNTDVTHEREAQEALRRSNEDLQRFGYVISHDLQEPLRQVTAFSQMLARRYGTDGEAKEFSDYVMSGTRRMQTIIRDLLLMADPGRELPVECFESAEALQDAIAAVEHDLKETGGNIVVDEPLPKVVAPRPVLRQTFQNLLSNAIKYRREDERPEIHIRGHRADGDWAFAVSDNGAGIPPEYRNRLFQWFSRVPGTRAAGSGIGLASVQRMLERAGGRIWVESEVGSGSTFHFTVPVSEEPVEC